MMDGHDLESVLVDACFPPKSANQIGQRFVDKAGWFESQRFESESTLVPTRHWMLKLPHSFDGVT